MRGDSSWPIPASERVSFLYLEHVRLERDGNMLVATSGDGVVPIPIGRTNAVLLGPGTSMTHAAADVCAREGALVQWVGEQGVRLYASSNPRSNAEALLRQASIRLDPRKRLKAARAIWTRMFSQEPASNRSIDQLRGEEGAKVREWLPKIAAECGVAWHRRDGNSTDPVNRAINIATSTLYGLAECVTLALGYSPAIGMIHSGDPRSFVFDIADTVKFRTVVPLAMRAVAKGAQPLEIGVRRACRDLFYESGMANEMVNCVKEVLDAADRA